MGAYADGVAEAELLLRAGRGDEAAFLLLYERHRTPVFRFACRMLGSAQQAEDVTQECFLSILRRPEAFQAERASLRTYLCAIARHLALKQLRKRGQETLVDDPPEEAPGGGRPRGRDPLSTVIEAEAAEAVRSAVEALPPLQREAVRAVRVPGPEPGRRRDGVRGGRGDGEVAPPPGARAPAEDAHAAPGGPAARLAPGERETRP